MTRAGWILDTDLREDVVEVLFLAAGRPEASLTGITLVQWLENDPDGQICRELERFLPAGASIHPGVSRPLLKRSGRGMSCHEETAAVSSILDHAVPHAVEHMAGVLAEAPEPVDILCLGPLTNLALLLSTRPDLKQRIGRVVFRGGALYAGDVTGAAEYNVCRDPEAAHIVFSAGLDLSMVPLEALRKGAKAGLHRDPGENGAGQTGRALLEFWDGQVRTVAGGRPLHSLAACLYFTAPERFHYEHHAVRIDLTGDQTRGSTVTDLRDLPGEAPDCRVVLDLREGDLDDLMKDRQSLERLRKERSL